MEKFIHRDNPQKLYIQLSEIMRRNIEEKQWDIGFQIPTEEELCKTYNVSRATVRAALSDLVRHGYLIRQQGKGTFVNKKIVSGELTMLTSFTEHLLDTKAETTTDLIAHTTIMPVDDLDVKLNIPISEHVIYIRRLRKADHKPVMIQDTYVPVRVCPHLLDEDVREMSLFEIFEKKQGIPLTRVQNTFDLIMLDQNDSTIFDIAAGMKTVCLHQVFFSWETPVMYTRSISAPDSIKFFVVFEKKSHE